jgi:hypothetical protein
MFASNHSEPVIFQNFDGKATVFTTKFDEIVQSACIKFYQILFANDVAMFDSNVNPFPNTLFRVCTVQ